MNLELQERTLEVEVDGHQYKVNLESRRGSFIAYVGGGDSPYVYSDTWDGLPDKVRRHLADVASEREAARRKAEAEAEIARKRREQAFPAMLQTNKGLERVTVRGLARNSGRQGDVLITRADGTKTRAYRGQLTPIVTDEEKQAYADLQAKRARLQAEDDALGASYREVSDALWFNEKEHGWRGKEKVTLQAEYDPETHLFSVVIDGDVISAPEFRDLDGRASDHFVAKTHPYFVEYRPWRFDEESQEGGKYEGFEWPEDVKYRVFLWNEDFPFTPDGSDKVYTSEFEANQHLVLQAEIARVNEEIKVWERAHDLDFASLELA